MYFQLSYYLFAFQNTSPDLPMIMHLKKCVLIWHLKNMYKFIDMYLCILIEDVLWLWHLHSLDLYILHVFAHTQNFPWPTYLYTLHTGIRYTFVYSTHVCFLHTSICCTLLHTCTKYALFRVHTRPYAAHFYTRTNCPLCRVYTSRVYPLLFSKQITKINMCFNVQSIAFGVSFNVTISHSISLVSFQR